MSQTHYFIAVPIDSIVKEKIFNWNERENPPFKRLVHKQDYHITLVFLGGIGESMLKELQKELNKVVTIHAAFTLTIDELGIFGPQNRPRIFWAGVKKEEKLFELQKAIFQTCTDLGIEVDKRSYNPHITLARKYSGDDPYVSDQLNASFQSYMESETWQVSNIVIYRTNLDKVPKYEVVASFPLESS